jgi:hypothetical protein
MHLKINIKIRGWMAGSSLVRTFWPTLNDQPERVVGELGGLMVR